MPTKSTLGLAAHSEPGLIEGYSSGQFFSSVPQLALPASSMYRPEKVMRVIAQPSHRAYVPVHLGWQAWPTQRSQQDDFGEQEMRRTLLSLHVASKPAAACPIDEVLKSHRLITLFVILEMKGIQKSHQVPIDSVESRWTWKEHYLQLVQKTLLRHRRLKASRFSAELTWNATTRMDWPTFRLWIENVLSDMAMRLQEVTKQMKPRQEQSREGTAQPLKN